MKNLLKTNHPKNCSFSSKLNWFLFFTLLVLVLNLDTTKTIKEKTNNKNEKTDTNKEKNTKSNTDTSVQGALKGIFWVQRMYPGNDVFDLIKESEYKNTKKYLEVNDQVIFIAKSKAGFCGLNVLY